MLEIWRDIKGFEGLYQVSNLGRVKSLERESWNGHSWIKQREIISNGSLHRSGYMTKVLYKNNVGHNVRVHQLVAKAFIENPLNKPMVNHIDENKANNQVDNLEWVTAKENNNHGTAISRSAKTRGFNVRCIETGEVYDSVRLCAREMELNQSAIRKQLLGKQRTHKGYTFEYLDEETLR